MNKAILMGRLTRDPEVRQTTNGISVTRFTIAVNRRFQREGSQEADFINCVAWRETGERIARFFHKGSMIAVVGSIQTRSWDGQDGKRQYATEVVVDEWDFTGSKAESGSGDFSQQQFAPPAAPAQNQQSAAPVNAPGFEEIEAMGFAPIDGADDDLPF